ncbi:MAG: L,D-transpeptidase [Bosea sp. (in: a-proteobacteria)]
MLRRFVLAAMAMFALFGTAGLAAAGVNIRVDLSSQRMQVQTPDGESYNWAVSSGREGYRTIRGSFRPTRLEKKWYSRKYGGNMPNAIFFRGGFAIHGTGAVGALGRPASHGCVRLHPANAAKLFALVQKHGKGSTRIAINGIAPDQNSQFAKAKAQKSKVQLAKAKKKGTDWATARGRMLDRGDRYVDPGAALGFQPVNRHQGDWFLRR